MKHLSMLALMVGSWLGASPAWSQTCWRTTAGKEACTYHGVTFTTDQVMRFAPEVQFHFAERYFPVSLDHLLAELETISDAEVRALLEQTGGQA